MLASPSPSDPAAGIRRFAQIDMTTTDLAVLVCSTDGRIIDASGPARALLVNLDMTRGQPLPGSLSRQLDSVPGGVATVWHPEGTDRAIGCSRYRASGDADLVLLREVSKRHAELSQALHKQRLESMGRLAATTAHDLRTCVASIIYNLDVLDTGRARANEELLDETLREIRQSSDRLQRAIQGLLDFGRAGRASSTMVSLESVFVRVAAWLHPAVSEAQHRFEFPTGSLPVVLGHQITIEQILTNLVLNAIEAQDRPSSIRLEVGEADECHVEVRVVDDGPGLAPEIEQRVFEPFFTTKLDGSGLGLSSAREAARRIGGDVYVISAHRGTIMGVRLRRAGAGPV